MDEHTRPEFARSALITIDVQRDVLSECPNGIPGTTEALPTMRRLADAFRAAGRPIVHVVRLYLPDGSNADLCRRSFAQSTAFLRPHTTGAELAEGLVPADAPSLATEALLAGAVQTVGPNEHILYKPRWSAFHRTQLEQHLLSRGVTTIVLVGANYPNCPRSSLIAATERDFRVVAVQDGISGWTDYAASELAGLGMVVLPSAEIIASVTESTAAAGTVPA